MREFGIDEIEIGKLARQQFRVREPGKFILRRNTRHRDSALGERIRTVALSVVGRDHGLAFADQHAQPHVVAFGARAFLDRSIAHVDRQRDRANRNRVGCVRAGTARRADETLGKVDQLGLVEKGRHEFVTL